MLGIEASRTTSLRDHTKGDNDGKTVQPRENVSPERLQYDVGLRKRLTGVFAYGIASPLSQSHQPVLNAADPVPPAAGKINNHANSRSCLGHVVPRLPYWPFDVGP
jgi:hypothetical protein